MLKFIAFLILHGIAMAAGFALGIYLLLNPDCAERTERCRSYSGLGPVSVVVCCETFAEFIAVAVYTMDG